MRLRFGLLFFIMPALALADVEMRFSDGSMALVRRNQVLLGDEQSAALWNGDNKELIIVSHDEKTWMRIEPVFAEDVAAQMKVQMEQMLAELPPEQRAVAELQMQEVMPSLEQGPPDISVRRTGGRTETAGYVCAEAELAYDGGEPEEAVCIATPDELGMSSSDYRTLNDAMRGIAKLAAMESGSGPAADFDQMGGIPIRTLDIRSGQGSELVSIDNKAVNASRMSIPTGFREVSIEEMMSQ